MNLYIRASFATAQRVDPTRTSQLRADYERALIRRFRVLQRMIRAAVGYDDALSVNEIARVPRFTFERDPAKIDGFMDWVRGASDAGILEITPGTPNRSAASKSWQNIYLRSAYQKGLANAAATVRKAGATVEPTYVDGAFYRPVHADGVGIIYTRGYRSLKGVTDAMDAGISRTLAQGLTEGVGSSELGRRIAADVEDIGIARARLIARTEIVNAHSEATLNSFQEMGMDGVEVLAEFSTAGDGNVCPRCSALEGKVYAIAEARGLIPVHPRCRCAFIPAVKDLRGVILR